MALIPSLDSKGHIVPSFLAYAHKLWRYGNNGSWYDFTMVVINPQHETGIVVRRDGHTVTLVRLGSGRLGCERLTETAFREAWQEAPYPLQETIDRFLEHGKIHGCTQEALKGLTRLQERDRTVVASLF